MKNPKLKLRELVAREPEMKWLTRKQAAAQIRGCDRWVDKLIRAGKIRGFKVDGGRRVMIPIEDVEAYVQAKQIQIAPEGK
jgi:excisionase family DNA binding protein